MVTNKDIFNAENTKKAIELIDSQTTELYNEPEYAAFANRQDYIDDLMSKAPEIYRQLFEDYKEAITQTNNYKQTILYYLMKNSNNN